MVQCGPLTWSMTLCESSWTVMLLTRVSCNFSVLIFVFCRFEAENKKAIFFGNRKIMFGPKLFYTKLNTGKNIFGPKFFVFRSFFTLKRTSPKQIIDKIKIYTVKITIIITILFLLMWLQLWPVHCASLMVWKMGFFFLNKFKYHSSNFVLSHFSTINFKRYQVSVMKFY